jgi:hypothetical protein
MLFNPSAGALHQHARYTVLRQALIVLWIGQTARVELHAVQLDGIDMPFLRALFTPHGHWVIVDLLHLLPRCYAHDVATSPRRDLDGLTLYAIRDTYQCAGDFEFAAAAKAKSFYTAPAALQRAAA